MLFYNQGATPASSFEICEDAMLEIAERVAVVEHVDGNVKVFLHPRGQAALG